MDNTMTETMTMTTKTRSVPERFTSAYDWTAAAGEIDELRALEPGSRALDLYVAQSHANALEHGEGDVSEWALFGLHTWLRRDAK